MILPDDLYDYAEDRQRDRRGSRYLDHDSAGVGCRTIADDWPDDVPVTEAEVDVFEHYFGPLLDELLGSSRS